MAQTMNRITVRPSDSPASRLASWLSKVLLALASIGSPALAADDPPGRVGRVTEGQGQSWVFDTESNEWTSLERNRPLTTGARIAVDSGGRLELRIGSTAVRLAGGSELEIRRLDDDRIDLFLHDGSAAVRVRSAEVAREVEVATVEGSFSPRGAGHFRVDRRDDSGVGTAWVGELQFESDDSALSIPAGRSAELWREGVKNATHYAWSEPAQDEFADWTARANREDDRVGMPEYVSPEMTGSEDLNRYGRWESNAEYGPLWIPNTVVAGWAPYRYGYWVVVQPWGWTWVDYAPWGFAPFHYGRWVYIGGSWCWAPGQRVARPVYSPAMVAWIGGGGPYARGAWPYLGWVPLAPREPYYPHYTSGGGSYWRAVNSAQMNLFPSNTPRRPPVSPILYANQGVAGAVSVVPGNTLVPRRPVAPVVAQVDPSVRSSFATQPWRTHVPPPGVARPIAVPGVVGTRATPAVPPPRAPGQPPTPRPPGRQPSPAVMAQPATPSAGVAPDGRRERIPRTVPPPPNAAQSPMPPRATTTPPAGTRPPGQGNAAPPGQPRAWQPAQPGMPAPNTPAAPRTPAAPPAAQVPAPPVLPPAPAAPGSIEPSSPGPPRSPGRSSRLPATQPPQARAAPAPAAAVAATPQRHADRVAPPPRGGQPVARQRAAGEPPDAPARVRVPEWQGHPSRAQMR